jgi:hypothetical protein
MTRVSWTSLPLGDRRCIFYSPRFCRTYLLGDELATTTVLSVVFGLSASNRRDLLPDPAASVELVGDFEKSLGSLLGQAMGAEREAVFRWFLSLLYIFSHRYRTVASIGRTICLARWLVRLQRNRRRWGPLEIGRVVMAVERSVGISDCYPRALLTAYLCLTAGLSCQITVGILAPTKLLHAWCSTGGVIPYEPVPRHWWYSPLVIFEISQ